MVFRAKWDRWVPPVHKELPVLMALMVKAVRWVQLGQWDRRGR